VSIMICDNCKIERPIVDFIKNKKYCFRCEYRKKMEKEPEYRPLKKFKCRICGKEFSHEKNLKKRQRTVFCSQECAQKGHKELCNNYWTTRFRAKGAF